MSTSDQQPGSCAWFEAQIKAWNEGDDWPFPPLCPREGTELAQHLSGNLLQAQQLEAEAAVDLMYQAANGLADTAAKVLLAANQIRKTL